jgi:hypothetical protein
MARHSAAARSNAGSTHPRARIATCRTQSSTNIWDLIRHASTPREAGTLDVGVETIRAEQIILDPSRHSAHRSRDRRRNQIAALELHLRPRVMHWKRLMQIWDGTREIA